MQVIGRFANLDVELYRTQEEIEAEIAAAAAEARVRASAEEAQRRAVEEARTAEQRAADEAQMAEQREAEQREAAERLVRKTARLILMNRRMDAARQRGEPFRDSTEAYNYFFGDGVCVATDLQEMTMLESVLRTEMLKFEQRAAR